VKPTSIVKVTLPFSACFLGVLLAGTWALIRGLMSPRAFGIALAILCVLSVAVLSIVWSRIARKAEAKDALSPSPSLGESTRRGRLRVIRVYQGWIALLVVCLLYGISKAGTVPVAPLAVGIVMNVLLIFACVQTIKKLQDTLK
jgi:ABC-type branched-subunit amino acid transport system permease subunit